MFVGITNEPRDYAWGSTTAIAELFGTVPSGKPEAELWLGTHPGSPSLTETGTLAEITELPFLLKLLAAGSPISLQVHPTTEQAEAGFAKENAAGIPVDAPNRNYRDPYAKPEMVYALTQFRMLCGFRPVAETRKLIAPMQADTRTAPLLDRLVDDSSIESVFTWLISRGDGVSELLVALAGNGWDGPEWDTVRTLSAAFPGDPGIAIALLLNHVDLAPGEAIFVPARAIHSGQSGLGIELLGPSDNVLRGGLTPKHVDVAELLSVVDFAPWQVQLLEPTEIDGVGEYRPEGTSLSLLRATGSASIELDGDAIALCTNGSWQITGDGSSGALNRGQSLYISADERLLRLDGTGEVFVATTLN